jgi:hypothetical protein
MPRLQLKNLTQSLNRFKNYCADRGALGYRNGILSIRGLEITVTPECFFYFLRTFVSIRIENRNENENETYRIIREKYKGGNGKYCYITEINGYKVQAFFDDPIILPEKNKIVTDLQEEVTKYLKQVKGI